MNYSIDVLSDFSERVPYNVEGFPVYARRISSSTFRSFRVASHWHDDLEISVVLSGQMACAINEGIISIRSGEGIFINSRQLHQNYSADGNDFEYIAILLHPSLFCTSRYVSETYISPLVHNQGFAHTLLKPETPWQAELMDLVHCIHDALTQQPEAFALTVQTYSAQAVSCLYQHMPAVQSLNPPIDRRIVALRKMVGFIQQHYMEKITLDEIAAAGNVSRSSCFTIFQRQLRQTPMAYLAQYRLEKAILLLEQPDLSISDIALAVGFSSASYFAETFRSTLATSPSEYRKAKR